MSYMGNRMNKYGFIYLWYDRKHKRYYIGAHWGLKNDGYIWWNNGIINKKSKEQPSEEWIQGKLPHNKSYNSDKMKEIWAKRKAGKLPMPNYEKLGG